MTMGADREPHGYVDLEQLLTWRESSTSGTAISALALTRGRNPDAPRHLGQVVRLELA